jgi:hypothetical protein
MRKTKELNNISKELEESLDLPKGKKTVRFRLINVKFNEKTGRWEGPFSKNIKSKFSIYDEKKDEYVDMAYLKAVRGDGTYDLGEVEFMKSAGFELKLHARPEDIEMCKILLLHPNFADNAAKYNAEPIFEMVRPEKTAAEKRRVRGMKQDALTIAMDMTDEQVRAFAASIGKNAEADIEVLREAVESYAESKPMEFVERGVLKSDEIELLVKQADKGGVIEWQKDDNSWYWPGGEKITSIPRGVQPGKFKGLAEFLMENTEVAQEVNLRLKATQK